MGWAERQNAAARAKGAGYKGHEPKQDSTVAKFYEVERTRASKRGQWQALWRRFREAVTR